jgi:hypothetical protein
MPRDSHLSLMRVIQENLKQRRQVGLSSMQVTLPNDLSYALMIRLKCENLKFVMQFILSQECLSVVWFCGIWQWQLILFLTFHFQIVNMS